MPVPERPEWLQRPRCRGRDVPGGSHRHLEAVPERGTLAPPPTLNPARSGTCSKCSIIRNYPRMDADDRGVCGNRRVGMKAPRACCVESSGLSLRTSERHISQMNIRCKCCFSLRQSVGHVLPCLSGLYEVRQSVCSSVQFPNSPSVPRASCGIGAREPMGAPRPVSGSSDCVRIMFGSFRLVIGAGSGLYDDLEREPDGNGSYRGPEGDGDGLPEQYPCSGSTACHEHGGGELAWDR